MKITTDYGECGNKYWYNSPKTVSNQESHETIEMSIPQLLESVLAALRNQEDELNRLNVYPVPDGDTGSNMLLTMKSVLSEACKVDAYSIKEYSQAIIRGSLMGARGNSGVILSQIIRGFCEGLSDEENLAPHTVVGALRNASDVAYVAVKKPV
ncbi:MAG: DAK2 domain-containing protein, partial [Rubrobacteridae bacterium]|nr:DAK2 domain-containing protein [Rubrobacteridae bacterium]